jgi:hypothetical protein
MAPLTSTYLLRHLVNCRMNTINLSHKQPLKPYLAPRVSLLLLFSVTTGLCTTLLLVTKLSSFIIHERVPRDVNFTAPSNDHRSKETGGGLSWGWGRNLGTVAPSRSRHPERDWQSESSTLKFCLPSKSWEHGLVTKGMLCDPKRSKISSKIALLWLNQSASIG